MANPPSSAPIAIQRLVRSASGASRTSREMSQARPVYWCVQRQRPVSISQSPPPDGLLAVWPHGPVAGSQSSSPASQTSYTGRYSGESTVVEDYGDTGSASGTAVEGTTEKTKGKSEESLRKVSGAGSLWGKLMMDSKVAEISSFFNT